jgi:2-deoxy-D-gluconate 3-dehydrogenase
MTLPPPPSFRLDGRRALVTGASSGIGLACAAALAGSGARVTLVARGAEALEAARDAMAAEGWAVEVAALDVTDGPAVERLVAGAAAGTGPFDVLVNAAGLARHAPALDTPLEDFDAVMGVNLRAAFALSREVARALITAGRPGSIVNVSSQMGHVGGPDRAVYCASKHGVEGMTKAMALEWGPHGIRVNTLCPTFVRTPLTEATFADPERRAWVESKIALGRVGELSDMTGPCVFLASDASALVTGTALLVDGGWTAA